jgi:type II secretory pathway component GspD/PulD (secretin)
MFWHDRQSLAINRGKEARVARGTWTIGVRVATVALLALVVLLSTVPLYAQGPPQLQPRGRLLMQQAREAYVRGDFESAAGLYAQAQQQSDQLTAEERGDLDSQMRQNGFALKAQREGRAQLKQAGEALDKGLRHKASILLRAASTNQYLTTADKQLLNQLNQRLVQVPATTAAGPTPVPQLPPKDYGTLLKEARAAFNQGDLQTAERLAQQADKANSGILPNWMHPWNDSPSRILSDIQVARAKKEVPPDPRKPDEIAKSGGIAPIQAVRNALGWKNQQSPPSGDSKVPGGKEERGSKTGAVASTSIPNVPSAGPAPKQPAAPGPKADPRELLRYGRELFQAGNFDEADKYCTRAEAANARWWLFDRDNPTKLRNDIHNARNKRNREEAVKMLVRARQLYNQGKLKEAEDLSYQAEKLHGDYGLWDFGDRPDKLRNDILAAKIKQRTDLVPPPVGAEGPRQTVVQAKSPPALPDTPPAPPSGKSVEQVQARQKVLMLLGQARQLQAQRRLPEAWARAQEARQAALEARGKYGVTFGPNEDSPEFALSQLSGQASQEIQTLVTQADRMVLGSNDPGRLPTAAGLLQQAHRLCVAFSFPVSPVEQKLTWIAQAQQSGQGQPAVAQNAPDAAGAANPNQMQGKTLINNALNELRTGQTRQAYKIACEAFDPRYGVQQEANEVLRKIEAEEFNQKILTANRAADAVRDAYVHGDYRRAYQIAQTIDVRILTPDRRNRLSEILQMPEMQPGGAVVPASGMVTGPDTPGKAHVTDQGPAPGSPPSVAEQSGQPGFADHFKAMEEVLYAKLRRESLTVIKRAQEEFRNGDYDTALEILRDYKDRVARENLAPERKAQLQRSVEARYQQLKVLKAQKLISDQQREALANKGAPREQIRALNKMKRDQLVSDKLNECRELYKQRKFKEARILAEQAKDLDPDNEAATIAWEMSNIAANKNKFEKDEHEKEDYFFNELQITPGKHLTIKDPMSLDPDRLKRAQQRNKNHARGYQLGNLRDSKEIEIEHRLETPVPNLNFKDLPLKEVLNDLATLSGINIVEDTAALQERGISLDQPLSLRVENISLKSTLNLLLQKVHLTWMIKEQVLQITTEEKAKGKLVQRVFPVADLVIPVAENNQPDMPTLMDVMNGYNNAQQAYNGSPRVVTPQYMLGNPQNVSQYNPQGGSGFGAAPGHQAPPQPSPGPGVNPGAWSVGNPRRTIDDQLIKLITATIAPESWSEVGGKGTIQYFPLGHGLVVNQTQDVQEQVADLLQALRRLQDLEVAIEIRLIAVSESFFEYIGVHFDLNITTPQTRYEPQLVTGQFQPGAFVNRFLPKGFVSGLTPAGTFTPDLNIPINNSSFNYTIPQIGGFPGALGADGGVSLGLAFLSDIQVFLFMEAAQGDRRANVMQAPRVTVFNGQNASLTVTDNIPFLLNIAPTFAADQLFFVPNQVALPIGTAINVTPVVYADRRFVRLSISQTMTNLISANVPLVPITVPVIPQTFQDGVVAAQPKIFQVFLQQPAVSAINVNTTVTVPDGGTVLLGGLKALAEERSEFGPPILSKIPYLDRLFRNVGYGREASSLMMMVTPRIIINEEEELIFLEELPPIPRP